MFCVVNAHVECHSTLSLIIQVLTILNQVLLIQCLILSILLQWWPLLQHTLLQCSLNQPLFLTIKCMLQAWYILHQLRPLHTRALQSSTCHSLLIQHLFKCQLNLILCNLPTNLLCRLLHLLRCTLPIIVVCCDSSTYVSIITCYYMYSLVRYIACTNLTWLHKVSCCVY